VDNGLIERERGSYKGTINSPAYWSIRMRTMKPGDDPRAVDYGLVPVPSSLVSAAKTRTVWPLYRRMSCAKKLEPKDQMMTPLWHAA
jgi:hypothetical protein